MGRFLRRGMITFAVSFTVLFLIRLAYGFTRPPAQDLTALQSRAYALVPEGGFGVRNIATAKMKLAGDGGTQALTVDQKYEKVSDISSRTERFDQDERKLRGAIAKFSALIQYERRSGLEGGRSLQMAIGVLPDSFDAMVAEVKEIGTVTSFAVNKTDKTNEYKDLLAKKKSLEQTRNSLVALKSKGGKIEEFIALENRILQVEQELQALGVSLGEFDAENEFCTINFTLAEKGKIQPIPLIRRLYDALVWTIKWYLALAACLLLACLLALAFLALLEKLKVLAGCVEKGAGKA